MSSASSVSGASGAPTAEQPQQGVPNTPTGNQGVPAQPVPGTTQEPQQPNVANPEAQRYAQEAAAERQRAKALEAELKTFKDAQLSAEQKRERDHANLQSQNAEYLTELQSLRLERAAEKLLKPLGFLPEADASDVLKLLDPSTVEYEDSGQPKNLEKLLKALVEAKPWLKAPEQAPQANGQPQQQQQGIRPPITAGGALSPARSTTPTPQRSAADMHRLDQVNWSR